ncbi:hypothetical protein JH25_27675 [Pseudomonas sp. BRG-100]|uniref:STN domain-containing protein n=1 Tax=Pseudomonas sp. BRG-100 TaxID=1524267 RepID=UPI0004E60A17|nr:STN domain-containing protein [Pseudomonas sp. BRG-100]KFF42157.1 hypothetical protein JH25_27675 [Pseudomonas sp. BRG-100]
MIYPTTVIRIFGLLLLSLQPLYSTAIFAKSESQFYSIDAGPLDQALSRFGVQAGINLAVSSTLTEGKYSNELQGNFSTIAGLERLSEGTGLSFQLNANDSFKLHPTTVP